MYAKETVLQRQVMDDLKASICKINTTRTKGEPNQETEASHDIESKLRCLNCATTGPTCYCTASKKEKKDNTNVENITTKEENPIESWVLDSGASFHASSNKEKFLNFEKSGDFGTFVHLMDSKPLKITGLGDIQIKSSNGFRWMIRGVQYVPGLTKNLISIRQLISDGYKVVISDKSWKIIKGSMVVGRGTKIGTLFFTDNNMELLTVWGDTVDPVIWHSRLRHMSQKDFKILANKGLLPKVKLVEMNFCEGCVFGKQKHVSFVKTGHGRTVAIFSCFLIFLVFFLAYFLRK